MKCGARKSDKCLPSHCNILERGSPEQKALCGLLGDGLHSAYTSLWCGLKEEKVGTFQQPFSVSVSCSLHSKDRKPSKKRETNVVAFLPFLPPQKSVQQQILVDHALQPASGNTYRKGFGKYNKPKYFMRMSAQFQMLS